MRDTIDPRLPCPFAPGSRGKVAWLRARVAARLPLWHPLDNCAEATPTDPKSRNRRRLDSRHRLRLAI
jgi:hypothetical protein